MGGSISRTGSAPKVIETLDDPSRAAPTGAPSAVPDAAAAARRAAQSAGGGAAASDVTMADATSAPAEQQRVVPTVFRWEHGGNNVYITGTFNGWGRKIPMYRSGNDFVYIQSLTAGKHAYKFVVDDEWRFAPDQPRATDVEGNINNVIDLSNFHPEDEADGDDLVTPLSTGTAAAEAVRRRDSLGGAPYGHTLPDEEAYSKEPPLLPPHLRAIVLNQPSPDPADPAQLPVPAHVTLNHLYCTAIRDGLMVQTVTSRYRRKYMSTVFYSVAPVGGAAGGGAPGAGGGGVAAAARA